MKRLVFTALLCALLFSSAFAAQKGWIIEFEESGSTPELNIEIESSVSWFESQGISFGGESVFGSLSDSLADTAIESAGFSLAAQNGIEGIKREEGIAMVCSGLGLDDAGCRTAVLSEFSLLFNGAAIDISEEQAARVAKMPGVVSVTPNSEVTASAAGGYPNRQALQDIGLYKILGCGSDICNELSQRLDLGATGKGVKIAFIDTGIDFSHPAFGNCAGDGIEKSGCRIASGAGGFLSSENAASDSTGHGTAIASIAAGKDDPNGDGVQQENEVWSVAPGAEIIPISIGRCGGDLPYSGAAFESDAIDALRKAVDLYGWCLGDGSECVLSGGADVINISMNNAESSSADGPLAKAVDNAVDAGSVVVVSAGNIPAGQADGTPNSISSPGTARKAITVGAYGYYDFAKLSSNLSGAGHWFLMPGSGIGITLWDKGALMKPDVIAPGSAECAAKSGLVNSALCGQASGIAFPDGGCPVEGYGSISGTSVAAAYVSGLAALLKEKHPDWSPLEIKMAIRDSAKDVQLPIAGQGFGLVNAERALSLENRPPVAMLEPFGTKGNEIGPDYYQVKGLAFGEDFEKYTVEIGQTRVFGSTSKSAPWYSITPGRAKTAGYLLMDVLVGTLGETIIVGGHNIPLAQVFGMVKTGVNSAQNPVKELLSQIVKKLGITSSVVAGAISGFMTVLFTSQVVDASQDYHFPAQEFLLSNDRQLPWVQLKESYEPSTGVLLEDFNPYQWLGGNEGTQMLKLTVYGRHGQKSVDYLPFDYRLPDFEGSGLGFKCEKTGEAAPEFLEKRNWLWAMNLKERDGSERTVDCTGKYCDAAQLFIFFAETQSLAGRTLKEMDLSEKQFFLENISSGGKSKEQVLLDLSRKGFLVLPAGIENEAQVFYATEKAGWMDWRKAQYYPLDEYGEPVFEEAQAKAAGDWQNCLEFSGGKPLRNHPAFGNPDCTLDSDWAEFLGKAKAKALAGEPIGELSNIGASPELSALESAAGKCFGWEYGLENIYIDYSVPCDTKSARFEEWKNGNGDLAERLYSLNASLAMPQTFYLEKRDPLLPYNEGAKFVSLPLFLEQQRQIAAQVKRECDSAAGLCYLEIAGASPVEFSESEIPGFFDFFERHSFLQFGFSPFKKLGPEEIVFVEKNSMYKRGWHWAETAIQGTEIKMVSDSFSEDFKKDFKEFFSSQLEEAGINPDAWAVSVQNAGNPFPTGRYVLNSDFTFDSGNADSIKISRASHSIELMEALSGRSNPFLFIPFDGEIGLVNGRQGYGAEIEVIDYPRARLYFTDEIPEINSDTPFGAYSQEKNRIIPSLGKNSGNIAKAKFDYSDAIDDVREGSAMAVSEKQGEFEITVKHSIPVRIRLFAMPSADPENIAFEGNAKIYYGLAKTQSDGLFPLEGYGAKKSIFTFVDFEGDIAEDKVAEKLPDCGNMAGTYDKITIAELEIPYYKILEFAAVSPYMLPSGDNITVPLAATVAFLPPNTKLVLHCITSDIGELEVLADYPSSTPGGQNTGSMRTGQGDEFVVNELLPEQIGPLSVREIADGVSSEKICANTAENGTDFAWNPVKAFSRYR
ncbi:MAG: S8 family serine peptidase [Candidatus Diapherotrites archaeon]